MGFNVLSCFDGIGCGYMAFKKAGIKVDKYYASEIDKYAIKVSQKNHPDIIHLGSVTNIDFTQFIDKIDIVIGGSPCQDLSIANKNRKGLEGERSGLFYKFLEALEVIKPKYFLLENVNSMSKENKGIISQLLGVEPILIDSALVSAQQRRRLYWTNIPNITLPEDRKIYLSDILQNEEDIAEKYYINNIKEINCVINAERLEKKFTTLNPDKAQTMTARQYASWNGTYFAEPIKLINIGNGGQGERVYYVNGKSTSLSALGGGRGAKTGLYLVSQRGRHIVDGKRKDILGAPTTQRLEVRTDGKTNNLSTVQKDNYVLIELEGEYYRIRKLTPIECERLQTLPDEYSSGISDAQRYKTLGNGWTVDVIAHIFKNIKENDNESNN